MRVQVGRPGAGQTLAGPSAISFPGRWLPGLGKLDYCSAMPIDRNDRPKHLFGIPDLDLYDAVSRGIPRCAQVANKVFHRITSLRIEASW